MSAKLPLEKRKQVLELRTQGLPYHEIAKIVGVSLRSAYVICNPESRQKEYNRVQNEPSSILKRIYDQFRIF